MEKMKRGQKDGKRTYDDVKEDYIFKFKFKTFWKFVGPGLLMSIAYIDPGNLAADLDAGRAGGYSLL